MVVLEKNSYENSVRRPIGYKVAPRRKAELRSIANRIRALPEIAKCYKNDGAYFDAIYLLEHVLPRAGYNLHVLEDDQLTETAAFAMPQHGLVVMKNSVYEGLFEDVPFSRYTVAHEFSHLVLDHAVTLHRNAVLGEHEWYEDSEWQANYLAAELMMPVDVIQRIGDRAVLIQSECGVSSKSATIRLNNLRKENLI